MESPSFHIARRAHDGVEILVPSGRVTLGQTVKDMRLALEQVAAESHRWVILDMSNVAYLDSAGLGTIVTGLNLFRKLGGDLALFGVQPRVSQLLDLTNISTILKIYPTEQEALHSITSAAQDGQASNTAS